MTLTLGLAGDVMIGRLVNEALDELPPGYIWGDMRATLQATDLNLINLEAALTHYSRPVPKVFNFRADPYKVQALMEGRIDVVNLANNHVLDYSEEGLLETLETLDRAHIAHVGAGRNAKEAAAPVILTRQGVKIGFLGCTDNEPGWKATDHTPGTRFLEKSSLLADVATLRPQVDLLIVSIHWGPNMRQRPPASFISFAHQLVDHGVDILHGHSAHLFQGVEIYKGSCLFYDTGDFVDDYAVDPYLRNDRSFFSVVKVENKRLKQLTLIPVVISQFQVNHAQGKEALEICQRMQQLSEERHTSLIFADNQLYIDFKYPI